MRSPKEKRRRPYRLQRRAEKQDETHAMLARAAFELHDSVGPSQTTVSAIAERAGVQRLTVYRHFPDAEAIFAACTAYSFGRDPPPNPDDWRSIVEPKKRLNFALRQLYEYYSRKHRLLANLYRDAEMPVVAAALSRRRQLLMKSVAILAVGWGPAGKEKERLFKALIGHAMAFATWRSLTEEQGLQQDEAIQLAAGFVVDGL